MGYNPWSMTQLAIFQFSHLAACTLPDFFFGNKYLSQNHSQQERCFLLQVLNILAFYGGVLANGKSCFGLRTKSSSSAHLSIASGCFRNQASIS